MRRNVLTIGCGVAVAMWGIGPANAQSADVVLSAPLMLARPAAYRPQYFPQAAWSAEAKAWLVVWQDGDPTEDGTGEGRAQDILAARVSADGRTLDAKPIAVAAVRGAQQRPRVASDGRDWLVAWHDLRNGRDWDVYAAQVSADGAVVKPGGDLLVGGERNRCFPDIVFAGGRYYVAWLDMRHWPEYRVYGSRVSVAGKALDGSGTELIHAMSDPELAAWRKAPFAPGKSGTGWHNFGVRGTSGMRQPGAPSLAGDGTAFWVTAGLHSDESDGYAVRVVDAASGKPRGSQESLPLVSGMGRNRWVRQGLAHVGDRGILSANLFYPAGFGASGESIWMTALIGADGRPVSGAEGNPFKTLYHDADARCPSGYRTYGLRTTFLGLAWDGQHALFVAEHHSQQPVSGNIGIRATLAGGDGERIGDGSALVIADGSAVQSAPAVAAGPAGRFLVVWQEEPADEDARIMARIAQVK